MTPQEVAALQGMTIAQEAAAFHGMATNASRSVSERLDLALHALNLYQVELERLQDLVPDKEDL